MNKRSELIELLKNDPFKLLDEGSNKKPLSREDNALISSFEEIQDYVEEHSREPRSNISDIIEFKLFSRLKAIRSDSKKIRVLKKYDFKGLLNGDQIKEITVEDILADDSLGLLDGDQDRDIFKLKNVKSTDRIKPDYFSRRKVCKEFYEYKDMFSMLHQELASKKRMLVRYNSSDLKIGNFYALNGVLLYLKSIDGNINKYEFGSGERERFDGRTLCIFDNGTQSEMLFRSLDKAMQIDGYSIGDITDINNLDQSANESDISNGYIYILKSLNPEVQKIQDLYKIGYTTGLVSERIRNAKNEATYLFNKVEVVATFRCFNIKSYNLEQTIHNFFSSVKLDIELLDRNEDSYRPKEWFKVNISVIEDAIKLILANKIDSYMYDAKINQIIKKSDLI